MNEVQRYLVEEFADDYLSSRLSRRDLLRRVLLITGSLTVTAGTLWALGCGSKKSEPASPTAVPIQPSPTIGAASGRGSAPPLAMTSESVVKEDDPAIAAGMVDFPGPAGKVLAYQARPKSGGPAPGVLVIHENRGLLEHIKDVARRFAKEGYVALAVDLVSRRGGTAQTDPNQIPAFLSASMDDLVADLNAGVDYLKAQSFVRQDRLGVIGFCLGGAYTWLVAMTNPSIKAAVPFYGPNARLDSIANITAAVSAVYGERDSFVTPQVPQVEEKLKATGKTYEIKVYPGAAHAFFNNTGASYNPEAAREAWTRTLDWFSRYLKG